MKITDPFGLIFVAIGAFIFFGLAFTRSFRPMSKWKEAKAEIDEVKEQKELHSVYYHVRFRDKHGVERRAMTLTYTESYSLPQLNPGDPVRIRYCSSTFGKTMAIIDEEGFVVGNEGQLPPAAVAFIMVFSLGFAILGLYLSGLLG